MRPFLTLWGLQEEKCVYWKVSVGLKCVRMSRIPWLWNLLSQYSLCTDVPPPNFSWGRGDVCAQAIPSIDSRLKQGFVFFRPPEVVNFRLKSLLETTFAQSKQICPFDDRDTHTRSIDLSQGLTNETWNPKCESRHSPFLARNANKNTSSETSRPAKNQKLEESSSQVVFAVWFPRNSRKFDEPVACESRDEFCACTIENWTVVGRGYFSHTSSYRENVASARRVANRMQVITNKIHQLNETVFSLRIGQTFFFKSFRKRFKAKSYTSTALLTNTVFTPQSRCTLTPSWHKWSDFEYRPWCLAIVVRTPPARSRKQ